MYSNNDFRYYTKNADGFLEHHGIMGMHWGIRRYQPYSVTGPRKSGESGKEIGLAKKSDSKDAKKNRKIWRTRNKAVAAAKKGNDKKVEKLLNKVSKLSGESKSQEAERIGKRTGDPKYLTNTNNKSLSTDKINQRVNKASKSDLYDIDFLEKIQNYSPAKGQSGGMTKQQNLREYREYLQDPEKYRKKDLSKKYKEIE